MCLLCAIKHKTLLLRSIHTGHNVYIRSKYTSSNIPLKTAGLQISLKSYGYSGAHQVSGKRYVLGTYL